MLPRAALGVLLLALAAACGGANGGSDDAAADAAGSDAAASATVRAGIDVLLAGDAAPLAGRRVGLITNHTGRTADGRSTIDALAEDTRLELAALFSPEHGIRGTADAGERVTDEVDEATGLPIYSLYGQTRAPTSTMLADLDALAFDIQDIGTRYYTYVWTMTLAMEAAAGAGIPFVVLDRPNPIGGELVQGNVLDTAYTTFVGLHPVPMRHGLTAGELATFVNVEFGVGADLTVIPAEGWTRDVWFDATGLEWRPPSPNMPSLESATHYPGTCLFEGTNLSVGRGTPMAFQQIGAPWLAADTLAARLTARELPGVRIEAVTFTPSAPGDRKYDGEAVPGLRFTVTDRATYDPTVTAVAVLVELMRLHADELTFRVAHFDRLAGSDRLRLQLLDGADVEAIVAPWDARRTAFEAAARRHHLYP
ncbi:MAG: DUF1343 domain-containing protein [Gemmatimonadota bacterium]